MADYNSIIKDLKAGIYAPVYFLQGEESFYIDNITDYIEQYALEESQKGFNQVVLYGKETGLTEVIGAARRYPMLGERQVVIVKEAQEIRDWGKEPIQTLMTSYLENPLPSTILVFAYKYKSLDQRTKIAKVIEKHAVTMNAKKIYDNQVPDWISAYCDARGLAIEKNALMLLSENIGNNLKRIANEIEKLEVNLRKGEPITVHTIQHYVGISKDYNIFELQKALGKQDRPKVHKIINYFASDPKNHPLVLTISGLFSYYTKLLLIHQSKSKDQNSIASLIGVNKYYVMEYLHAAKNYPMSKVMINLKHIKDADLQAKGIGYAPMSEGAILTELIYKLMH